MNATPVGETYLHEALVDRRQHLLHALDVHPDHEVADLLARVDAALARFDVGTFGICRTCHEPIDADRLAHDPLAEYCTEHPGPSDQDRLRRDLAFARQIQLGLLPRADLPIDGWRYAYRYDAAGEVGGDFWDVIARPHRNETLVLAGDVSGKGIAASMLMSHLVATFRSLASLPIAADELLARANGLFLESTTASAYATLALGALGPGGSIDLYSAGHWAPLVRRGSRVDSAPVVPGLPLGLFGDVDYTPTAVEIADGDTLLFFTDGAIDAENGNGDNYALHRLSRTLAAADVSDLQALVNRCAAEVRGFEEGASRLDDVLLAAVMPQPRRQ